jgi:hypothetical protein
VGNSEDGRQDGRVFFYIVVPPATTGPFELASSSCGAAAPLVWYCGLFQQARHREGAMRAVVDGAVAAKRRGEAFCKLAKDWARLEELVSTAAGGSAPRLDHLFAKTPVAVRSQLLLDATASYSVTDQATADDITAKCLRLPGVWSAGAAAPAAACVDLTACVGGNLLSFALGGFAKVVGVESDPARFAMLRHNVSVALPRHLAQRVELVCGDSTALLRTSSTSSCGSDRQASSFSSPSSSSSSSSSPSSSVAWPNPALYFLDPPWGGLEYKDQALVALRLGDDPIAAVCLRCLRLPGCLHVVLKGPFNADTAGLHALAQGAVHRSACGTQSFRVLRLQTWSLSKKVKCFVLSREAAEHTIPDAAPSGALCGAVPAAAGVELSLAEELAVMASEARMAREARPGGSGANRSEAGGSSGASGFGASRSQPLAAAARLEVLRQSTFGGSELLRREGEVGDVEERAAPKKNKKRSRDQRSDSEHGNRSGLAAKEPTKKKKKTKNKSRANGRY